MRSGEGNGHVQSVPSLAGGVCPSGWQPCCPTFLLRGLSGLQSGVPASRATCQQSCVPSGDSRRESIFLPFPPLRKLPTFLGLWLLASSVTNFDIYFCHISFSLLLLSYGDPCDDTGPTWIIQGGLPTSRSSISSHLQSPFCHTRSPSYRVWGRIWELSACHSWLGYPGSWPSAGRPWVGVPQEVVAPLSAQQALLYARPPHAAALPSAH